jgi:hypothetical protein
VCNGNQSIDATGVTATYTSGAAISASGNCRAKCTRCTLKAPIGVAAGGNAQITLVDSCLEGAPNGIVAGGNANVRLLGSSTLGGAVVKSGNAEVIAPPGAPTLSPTGPTPRRPAR